MPVRAVGVGVTPFQTDADATIRLAVGAEELGYGRFGTAEGWTHDAVVVLAQIAGVTSRIGLGTGVLPIWSRTPAAIAMAAASLQRASAGRFALGLGASSPPLVEGLHGIAWQQPLDRLRTTLVAVRALLDGARLPLDREGVRPLRLGAPPERRVPILLAAGWLLAYLTRMGPLYPRMLRDQFGFASEVDALLDANRDGGLPRLPAAAERLARDVTVMGTYDEAPDAVRLWLEAGADAIDLVLPLGLPEAQLHEMLEAAAPGEPQDEAAHT